MTMRMQMSIIYVRRELASLGVNNWGMYELLIQWVHTHVQTLIGIDPWVKA